MSPDTAVWISTPRNGISYHALEPGWRKTACGRYVGRDGEVERGHVFSLAEATDRFGSRACRNCLGEMVPPKVVPRG